MKKSNSVRSYLISIIVIGIFVFLCTRFFIQLCPVVGNSMNPTLKSGHFTLIWKCNFKDKLTRNDIIVIDPSNINQSIIKRIIGLPGDTVQIKEGKVYVNDEELTGDDKYDLIEDPGNAKSPVHLADDQYFVLGDNRNKSIDSRFDEIGIINSSEICGKVLFH